MWLSCSRCPRPCYAYLRYHVGHQNRHLSDARRGGDSSSSAEVTGTLYDVLRLPPDATDRQIKHAYFRLSKVHHPDRPGGDVDLFRRISDAYNVLSKQSTRARYDFSLRQQATRTGGGFDLSELSSYRRKGSSGGGRFWNYGDPGRGTSSPPHHHHHPHASPPPPPPQDWDESEIPIFKRESDIKREHFNHSAWMRGHYSSTVKRHASWKRHKRLHEEQFGPVRSKPSKQSSPVLIACAIFTLVYLVTNYFD